MELEKLNQTVEVNIPLLEEGTYTLVAYIATVEEVEEQITVAEEFIQMVEDYCNQHLDDIL